MSAFPSLVSPLAFIFLVLSTHCINVSDTSGNQSLEFPHELVGNIDTSNFDSPSGMCWHIERNTLFVVGDQGDIGELSTDGIVIKQKRISDSDFEGITVDPSTSLLYVVVEGKEEIIEINPETFNIIRTFPIPRILDGKTLLKEGGEGLEGITFVPDSGHPDGGVFYVANQCFDLTNTNDISAVFKVELPLKNSSGKIKLVSYFKPKVIDLAGLYFDRKTNHLFIVSDSNNELLEYTLNGEPIRTFVFPGKNQEGITADSNGFFYIAQDEGGIIKLKWLRD